MFPKIVLISIKSYPGNQTCNRDHKEDEYAEIFPKEPVSNQVIRMRIRLNFSDP